MPPVYCTCTYANQLKGSHDLRNASHGHSVSLAAGLPLRQPPVPPGGPAAAHPEVRQLRAGESLRQANTVPSVHACRHADWAAMWYMPSASHLLSSS